MNAVGALEKNALLLVSLMMRLMSVAALKGELEPAVETKLWFAEAGDKPTTVPHAS